MVWLADSGSSVVNQLDHNTKHSFSFAPLWKILSIICDYPVISCGVVLERNTEVGVGRTRVSESFFKVSRLGLHENPMASDLTRLKFEFSAKWRRETSVLQWLTLDSFCCLLSSASVLIG